MTVATKTSHKHQISWAVAILATVALATPVATTLFELGECAVGLDLRIVAGDGKVASFPVTIVPPPSTPGRQT